MTHKKYKLLSATGRRGCTTILIPGLISLIIGVAGLLVYRKERVYRRNVAGVEEFGGYGKAVITKLAEKFGKLIFGFFAVIGLLMTATSIFKLT